MKRIVLILVSLLLIPAFATGTDASKSLSIDTIQVLKIAPQDARAIIKTPDGKTRIINVGDKIGENGKVSEISSNKVVIEEKNIQGLSKVIIWLENGVQRIERIGR